MPRRRTDKSDNIPGADKSDIDILEYCLSILYERDCPELAKGLVERFGSVAGICNATVEELMRVRGMTERVATLFTVIQPLHRQALLRATDQVIDSERKLVTYATVYFLNEHAPREVCLCLNRANEVVCAERLVEDARLRELAVHACKRNAERAAIMRFEPSSASERALPSPEKQRFLLNAVNILGMLNISLIDYLEYGNNRFYSYRRALCGKPCFFGAEDASDEKYEQIDDMRKRAARYCARII